jgi:hypothetical protein
LQCSVGSASFKSDLFGYALLFGFAIALMLVIRHYSELYVWGLAIEARSPLVRYFLANSAIIWSPPLPRCRPEIH